MHSNMQTYTNLYSVANNSTVEYALEEIRNSLHTPQPLAFS